MAGAGTLRNDDCPCGSGAKYKRCCMQRDERASPALSVQVELDEGELAHYRLLDHEGQDHMHAGRLDEAEACFRAAIDLAPEVVWSHNNLAMCAFLRGDLEQAEQAARRLVEEIDAENVFAHASLAEYLLFLGRLDEAAQVASRIADLTHFDPSAMVKSCEAYAHLGWHEAIVELWERHARRDIHVGEILPDVHAWVGIACANVGDFDAARRHLKVVRGGELRATAARVRTALTRRVGPGTVDGLWPYFDRSEQFLPKAVLERVSAAAHDGEDDDVDPSTQWYAPLMLRVVQLEMNATRGELATLPAVAATIGGTYATALLQRIVTNAFGTDEFRMAAIFALASLGVIEPGASAAVLQKGQVQSIEVQSVEATPEVASTAGLNPTELKLYEHALELMRNDEFEQCATVFTALLKTAPHNASIHHNLACALLEQGRRVEAVAALLAAMEADPSYLFAPATLAALHLQDGDKAEAQRVIRATPIG
ncbi:MAG: tetratricopeptide repeat protein, partial [Thermoleophilia bacterium]|nr:tetratricopeptide repeat protein [Thermoleophilia bacterium]